MADFLSSVIQRRSPKKTASGFTLLELVVVLVLLGVIAAFAARPVAQTMEVWLGTMRGQTDRVEVHYALERVAREVREGNISCDDMGDISISCTETESGGLYEIEAELDGYKNSTDVFNRNQ
ncbi:prepilin-type N-terminal cleavage/methylation domain-containing protein [Desulfohalobium retbaense]|uniref:Prepilin-type N-terminal cleavage/methylation domain-containing protein n=1 Tax=Desulfohalobium retbaense (strain ATCC 49708 / DSM 5692 / JCM 16813 / HR100) TaxID=485915 RepID=C8X4R0_DESRD|nr:prepilin-type N-terminal cleavage/methylation domain-containing protein [Desulfohalobium retbaense]ACV69283.1 hypothetical protein Dret_1999 [Desulfohalobium retbaense DSM 5692]